MLLEIEFTKFTIGFVKSLFVTPVTGSYHLFRLSSHWKSKQNTWNINAVINVLFHSLKQQICFMYIYSTYGIRGVWTQHYFLSNLIVQWQT